MNINRKQLLTFITNERKLNPNKKIIFKDKNITNINLQDMTFKNILFDNMKINRVDDLRSFVHAVEKCFCELQRCAVFPVGGTIDYEYIHHFFLRIFSLF